MHTFYIQYTVYKLAAIVNIVLLCTLVTVRAFIEAITLMYLVLNFNFANAYNPFHIFTRQPQKSDNFRMKTFLLRHEHQTNEALIKSSYFIKTSHALTVSNCALVSA